MISRFAQVLQNLVFACTSFKESINLGIIFFLLSKYKTALRADLGPKLGNFENKSINSFNEDDVILKW
jgi:hypothetical protein